jgi:hypothetical protein
VGVPTFEEASAMNIVVVLKVAEAANNQSGQIKALAHTYTQTGTQITDTEYAEL